MEAAQPQPKVDLVDDDWLDEPIVFRQGIATAKEIRDSGLIGMWADRPETQDAPRFLAELRDRIWGRQGELVERHGRKRSR